MTVPSNDWSADRVKGRNKILPEIALVLDESFAPQTSERPHLSGWSQGRNPSQAMFRYRLTARPRRQGRDGTEDCRRKFEKVEQLAEPWRSHPEAAGQRPKAKAGLPVEQLPVLCGAP